MEHSDFKNPASIFLSIATFFAGLMSVETWAIIIGIICTVITTITAVRRNRSQEKYFNTKHRTLNSSKKIE